jgi:hypothetical protein
MNWLLVSLALVHLAAAFLVSRKARRFAAWNRRRRAFIYVYVWMTPLVGPLTTYVMMKDESAGEGDANLKYSIEYLEVTQNGHDHR